MAAPWRKHRSSIPVVEVLGGCSGDILRTTQPFPDRISHTLITSAVRKQGKSAVANYRKCFVIESVFKCDYWFKELISFQSHLVPCCL